MPASKIVVLVATGLHRPSHGAELEELIGDPWVLSTVQIANQMARDDAGHVDLGRTITRGTPIKIDRRFVEADIRIATGLVLAPTTISRTRVRFISAESRCPEW